MQIDVDAIRQRAEAASPGPWESKELGGAVAGSEYLVINGPSPFKAFTEPEAILCMYWPAHSAEELAQAEKLTGDTADFIAHARQDIPALLSALTEARAQLDAYECGPGGGKMGWVCVKCGRCLSPLRESCGCTEAPR